VATSDPTQAGAVAARPVFGAGLADPGPLGLGAFAMTTFYLSSVNAGWLSGSVTGVVLGLALFIGGLGQIIAGIWEFAKGNTFGAVAFCSFGGFWLSFWYLINDTDLSKASPHDVGHGLGFYLIGWAIFTGYMFLCSSKTTVVIMAVFLALTATFIFLAIGEFNLDAAGKGSTQIGGYLGLITALLAWYGSAAGVMNATHKRVILPVFPR
jgi:succinate-acetate transporter protein